MNQDITPPTSNQSFGTSPSTDPTPPTDAQQTPEQGKVIPLQSGPKKSKFKTVLLVLLFLLLLAGVAGAYFYQQAKVDDATTAKTAVDKKLATLQSQLSATQAKAVADAKKVVTPAVSYDVVTGDVTTQVVGTATINTLYKPTIKEIWLEYGTTPDALSTASKHITDGLGAGTADTYSQQSFAVTGLKSGQNYFYRVAAKSAAGTTIYGGVTGFTSTK